MAQEELREDLHTIVMTVLQPLLTGEACDDYDKVEAGNMKAKIRMRRRIFQLRKYGIPQIIDAAEGRFREAREIRDKGAA